MDIDVLCTSCGTVTPHRWRPSPEAGPFWRCSECNDIYPPDYHALRSGRWQWAGCSGVDAKLGWCLPMGVQDTILLSDGHTVWVPGVGDVDTCTAADVEEADRGPLR